MLPGPVKVRCALARAEDCRRGPAPDARWAAHSRLGATAAAFPGPGGLGTGDVRCGMFRARRTVDGLRAGCRAHRTGAATRAAEILPRRLQREAIKHGTPGR